MDDDSSSSSSGPRVLTPRTGTLSPQQSPLPIPLPAPSPRHEPGCPIATAGVASCPHGGGCGACLLHEHHDAAASGRLHQLCTCPAHNPSPAVQTPAGRQWLAAAVRAGGGADLWTLEMAREVVAWLASRLDDAVERVLQARLAGFAPDVDDAWVINEAGALMTRMMPRMEEGGGGAFSLDGGRVSIAPRAAAQPSPPRAARSAHENSQAAVARRRVAEVSYRLEVQLEQERQRQEQEKGKPQGQGKPQEKGQPPLAPFISHAKLCRHPHTPRPTTTTYTTTATATITTTTTTGEAAPASSTTTHALHQQQHYQQPPPPVHCFPPTAPGHLPPSNTPEPVANPFLPPPGSPPAMASAASPSPVPSHASLECQPPTPTIPPQTTPEALYGRPLTPFAAAISWLTPHPLDPYDPPPREEDHQPPAKTTPPPPPQPPHHVARDTVRVLGLGSPGRRRFNPLAPAPLYPGPSPGPGVNAPNWSYTAYPM